MGMYNEVYAPCPHCGRSCYLQIPQVILGFGNFDLERPSTTENLNQEEKVALKEILEQETFNCEEHGRFRVNVEITETKRRVFKI